MADDDQSAVLRREKRRQKILRSSEERMRKILGQSSFDGSEKKNDLSGSSESDNHHASLSGTVDANQDTDSSSSKSSHLNSEHKDWEFSSPDETSKHEHFTDIGVNGSSQRNSPARSNPDKPDNPFTKIRTAIVLITGILIRWSFQYSLGKNYVQSIVNPFMALEIAIIGYQKGVGMDLGENVKGGIWLSTLVLAGMKAEIIYTYKSVMGVFTAATADFALYFFGFLALHLVI